MQIALRNLENSNEENRSLFNYLHIHILFQNFRVWENHLLIKSIQIIWKYLNNS
jgi:hypothetical protein